MELVVAGSNPVDHPTLRSPLRSELRLGRSYSNFIRRLALDSAEGNLVPGPFVDVIKEDLREQFNAADGQRPFHPAGDEEGNDQGVQTAGEPPRHRLDETAIRFFSHAGKTIGMAGYKSTKSKGEAGLIQME